nr:CDP-glycerol glycerophosphotransferase family protein [uncultured Desulfobacter sp.]
MDAIQSILQQKTGKFSINEFNFQTWEDFRSNKENKKVFVFGIGNGAEYYLENNTGSVAGIIDNDRRKHGTSIDIHISDIASEKCLEKKVLNVSALYQHNKDEIVILITSLKASEQIAIQLENSGITNFFSLLAMEALRRPAFGTIESNDVPKECTKIIEQNKLVFYTMGSFSGHGKYIVAQLLKLRDDLDIVWIVDDFTLKLPAGIRIVYRKNKSKYIHEMETAKIWIYDDMVPLNIHKRMEQIYVQVKHWSSVTLKTFGFDLTTFRGEDTEIAICKHNSEMINYIITGSKFDTDTCRSGFGFQGDIIQIGSARSDILFDAGETVKKIYSYYNLADSEKILLYTPTFRCKQGEHYKPEAYETNIDYGILVKNLKKKFAGDWIVFLRLHPVVSEASKTMKRLDCVIDASDYPDSQELVAAADIMITDYSSMMFEPAFIRKPVFLFAPDRMEYINGERKLLIDYDDLPFPIAETNEALASRINNFSQEEYESKVDEFMKKYGVCEDGHASERAAKFISDLIDGTRVKE